MSLVVVRCPACLGESRVATEALGLTVGCPRCEVPFIAAEEVVPVVMPVLRGRSPLAPPVEPPHRRPRPRRAGEPQPEPQDGSSETPKIPDPEHDPHLPPVAGLPVSVLVGLALLPLAIPVFWWAAPFVTGQPAALSLAVPLSLAFAATTLCLGVVYTIDWTAATRIKGVLMLVGLAYLAAAGLYFLKKELVDRVQRFGGAGISWRYPDSADDTFRVRMPGEARRLVERAVEQPIPQPIPKVQMATGWEAKYKSEVTDNDYHYLALAGEFPKGQGKPDAAWIEAVGAHFAQNGTVTPPEPVRGPRDEDVCYQWTLQMKDNTRVVRVCVADGRVYYLSVEGRNIDAGDQELVRPFFNSFEIVKPNDKPKGKAKR
jgi:hypothetical protein